MPVAGVIQGQNADSLNEVNIARALEQARLSYYYHYDIGDISTRGGVEIDFVIYNGSQTIPVQVGAGGYFHSGRTAAEDLAKTLKIQQYGQWHGWEELKQVTLPESDTPDEARNWVRKEIQ